MPKISDRPLTRVCLRLWQDDYDAVQEMAQSGVDGATNTNEIIRTIVHDYIQRVKDLERRKLDQLA